MANPDARPEPILVGEFEGEYVRFMEGRLPAITLQMEEGWPRGTHLKLGVEVRVRGVQHDEITTKEHRGDLKRVHTLALEEVRMEGVFSADEADPGVGGSAGGSAPRIEERFEVTENARECQFDSVNLEVVHRGGCELCIQLVLSASGAADAGF